MKIPLRVRCQPYLPQRLITWIYGKLSQCRWLWFKNWAIHRFIRLYPIALHEAVEPDPNAYPNFHAFFTRQLQSDLRPIDNTPQGLCAPCDGVLTQCGPITEQILLQAKNHPYTLDALLGGQMDATPFHNGYYFTFYLAPQDYHRVHMPHQGMLQQMCYIPGQLFSVNTATTQAIKGIFTRNERVVALFNHNEHSFALVLVGAMIVGQITTAWAGPVGLYRHACLPHLIDYPQTPEHHIHFRKGEEMGYFSLGSTVIVLLPEGFTPEESLLPLSQVRMGQRIGSFPS